MMPRLPGNTLFRLAAVAAIFGACGTAFCAPPADHGAASQGRSSVDRALENRARLADRAADAAKHATTTAGGGTTTADAIGKAQFGVKGHASAAPRGVGLGVGGDANGHAAPQAGTGRIAREMIGSAARARSATNRGGLRLGLAKRNEPGMTRSTAIEAAGSARVANGLAVDPADRPRFDLTRADRLLAHRLAQIERMRDRAVETDDEELLRQADRLEVIARSQYSRRTDGQTRVGEAVTTFNETQRDLRRSTEPDDAASNTSQPSEDDSTPVSPSADAP